MLNIKEYLNNVSKLKENFFSNNVSREIGTKKNKFGIPVVVLDLKTKQSYEYRSIAEAARSFKTHPKTIWRIIYNNKLYLDRYQILEKKKELSILNYISKWYGNIYKCYNSLFYYIKSNKVFIYRVLLFVILSIFIFILIFFIITICKDLHDQYVFSLRESRDNFNKCISEHRVYLNHVLKNTNTITISNKPGFIDIKEWRFEYLFNPKWKSIHNNGKLGIYQSIINEINLDFNAKGTITFSRLNSTYSSPLIERVNINSIFSKAIELTNTTNDIPNSLGVQGLTSNRDSVIFDNLSINTRVKSTELLNYQSNILYCLINGLSPSIY